MRHVLQVAVVLAGVAACSFPSLTTSDGGAASDGYAEEQGSSSSSGGLDAASGDSSGGSDSDAVDDSPAEAPTGDGGPCDQDNDGYRSNSSACGGNDCCDTDANVHPGQTSWFTQQSNCKTFDYNCNGKNEPAYSSNLSCVLVWSVGCIPVCGAASCLCKGQSCTTGYPGPDPGCGNAFQFDDCKPANAFSCTPTTLVQSQAQACR
jgi:hypothetical protein